MPLAPLPFLALHFAATGVLATLMILHPHPFRSFLHPQCCHGIHHHDGPPLLHLSLPLSSFFTCLKSAYLPPVPSSLAPFFPAVSPTSSTYLFQKVSFPMGIFALYTMFTTYAAPLASHVILHPFLFVPAILLFTRCCPPFPFITNRRWLTFRIVLQDKAYARPSCLL